MASALLGWVLMQTKTVFLNKLALYSNSYIIACIDSVFATEYFKKKVFKALGVNYMLMVIFFHTLLIF